MAAAGVVPIGVQSFRMSSSVQDAIREEYNAAIGSVDDANSCSATNAGQPPCPSVPSAAAVVIVSPAARASRAMTSRSVWRAMERTSAGCGEPPQCTRRSTTSASIGCKANRPSITTTLLRGTRAVAMPPPPSPCSDATARAGSSAARSLRSCFKQRLAKARSYVAGLSRLPLPPPRPGGIRLEASRNGWSGTVVGDCTAPVATFVNVSRESSSASRPP